MKTDELLAGIEKVHAHIDKEYGKFRNRESRTVAGTMPCPICGKTLGFTRSDYNGHVHGRCETAGCLRWME